MGTPWGHRAGGTQALTPVPVLVQKVMEAMGVLAIVVNCYLIAQCGQLQRLFPWLSPEGAIVSVVVLEVRGGIRGFGGIWGRDRGYWGRDQGDWGGIRGIGIWGLMEFEMEELDFRIERPDFRIEGPDFGIEGLDYGMKGTDFGIEWLDFRTEGWDFVMKGLDLEMERPDFWKERPDLGMKGLDFGIKGPDFRIEWLDFGIEVADLGMEEQILEVPGMLSLSPCPPRVPSTLPCCSST